MNVTRYNTDSIRFFIGTAVQTWFPIVYALGWVNVDKETFGAIQAAIVLTVNSAFAMFKATPPGA